MSVSSGALYRTGTISVNQGSINVVGVNTSWLSALIAIAVGDIFTLDMKTWYEVVAVNNDLSLTLDRGFEATTKNGVNYAIIRNTSGTVLTRIAGQIAVQFNQKQLFLDELRTWLNSSNASENLTDSHGISTAVTTPAQMALNHSTSLAQMNTDFTATNNLAIGLTAGLTSMREVDFEANRQIRREKFDYKSGFVEFGKVHAGSVAEVSINQGLSSHIYASTTNTLAMGRYGIYGNAGISNTDNAIIDVAGVEYHVVDVNSSSAAISKIRFPDAPNGTVTYDSATGAVVDFTKDVDPKYGDVASTVNEAVSRAFEGSIKNGDFRLGATGWGAQVGRGTGVFEGGIVTITDTSRATSASTMSVTSALSMVVGNYYDIEVNVLSISGSGGYYRIGLGSAADLQYKTFEAGRKIFRNVLCDTITAGGNLFFYIGGDGTSDTIVEVDSIQCTPVTQEVVIERVDLAGIEFFPELITPTNPEVYPKGMIQSAATTMNGIATKATSTRPDSYHAVFDGDTASNRRNVDWFAATNEQRAIWSADPSNLIVHMKNGDIVQWKARQRTIAGAGNGDWDNLDSTGVGAFGFNGSSSRVKSQGHRDSVVSLGVGSATDFLSKHHSSSPLIDDGVFFDDSEGVSYNGECYFLVLGTVPRLNQGAYHPLNQLGCAGVRNVAGTGTVDWSNDSAREVNVKLDCFQFWDGSSGVATWIDSANIANGDPRNPTSRSYDAIYASGQGGFIDKRLSVSANLDREISQRKSDDKSGVSRGGEKLVRFAPTTVSVNAKSYFYTNNSKVVIYNAQSIKGFGLGDIIWCIPSGYSTVVPLEIIKVENSFVDCVTVDGSFPTALGIPAGVQLTSSYWLPTKTNTTVSGEFNVMEVIGDPVNILLTDALKDGWVGYWNSVIPDGGAAILVDMTRKSTYSGSYTLLHSVDNGGSWSVYTTTIDQTKNTLTVSSTNVVGSVKMLNYTTNAKITKESANPVVYRGEDGLGDVFLTSEYRVNTGSLLAESLSGVVLKASPDTVRSSLDLCKLIRSSSYNGALYTANVSVGVTEHFPLILGSPNNNSPAVKALWGTTEINGQVFPVYWWTELVWDYGADRVSEFTSVNVTTTYTYNKGNHYLLNHSVFGKHYLVAVKALTSSFSTTASNIAYFILSDNKLLDYDGNAMFELWSGNGWGDDSLIHVNNNTTTMTDLNGNTVKVGCAIGVDPIGWADKL